MLRINQQYRLHYPHVHISYISKSVLLVGSKQRIIISHMRFMDIFTIAITNKKNLGFPYKISPSKALVVQRIIFANLDNILNTDYAFVESKLSELGLVLGPCDDGGWRELDTTIDPEPDQYRPNYSKGIQILLTC